MKFELDENKWPLTDEEIIMDIKKVANKLNKDYISISIYKSNGKYSQCAIQGHFGTWKNALILAGLRTERNRDELKQIKNEDYINDLKKVAIHLNKSTVLFADYKLYGKYAAEHIFSRFQTWDDALFKAGLQPTGLSHHRIDEQTLIDEIERIWIELGRQPTSTDISKTNISKYSLDTYKRRFGSWRKALEAFVEYVNSEQLVEDDDEIEIANIYIASNEKGIDKNHRKEIVIQKRIHKTSRNINARLRFKVMQRDNFKCCACGTSPAKDPDVVLHIDHIIPWSKGGETVEENLQTLCSKCNLGKSNLL